MTAVAEPAAIPETLKKLERELREVLADSEREIGTLIRDFQNLAGQTSLIVETAGVIAGCAESEKMASVLPRVQQLGSVAKKFIRERLEATAGILDTVTSEAALLERLAVLTRGQKAIVRETEMLRVLTNIEVARLGEVGASFQYLAHELDDFSRAVAESTNELTSHTDERRKAVEETRRTLKVELPQMREEFARIEEGLDKALSAVERALGQLSGTPVRFRVCVEEIAGRIAGVVAAVQAHDITRQQIEHVCEALTMIGAGGDAEDRDSGEKRAGLKIQSYQLRNAGGTVRGWTSQIRNCLEGIGRIASSEILELGPVVLGQEREVSAQLTLIERLEEECTAGNAKVQASFAGISGLMQLVSEHLVRSKSVRDRLQLLMFNSIVEASHLGTQADGILEISTSIKRISSSWGEITAQSERATREIQGLVERSGGTLRAFSEESNSSLREAQAETKRGLEILREGAACADERGREIQTAIESLRDSIAEVSDTGSRLEGCFLRLESAVDTTEATEHEMEVNGGGSLEPYDLEALERRFSANYTTEMERAVLRAALCGGPMPTAVEEFAGNSVELF